MYKSIKSKATNSEYYETGTLKGMRSTSRGSSESHMSKSTRRLRNSKRRVTRKNSLRTTVRMQYQKEMNERFVKHVREKLRF